ncbi:MAG: hypothetical protein HS116_15140 [Planctomycetes bacterium]|nr:hypothetical protein [Planctomycetota bacterium]
MRNHGDPRISEPQHTPGPSSTGTRAPIEHPAPTPAKGREFDEVTTLGGKVVSTAFTAEDGHRVNPLRALEALERNPKFRRAFMAKNLEGKVTKLW